jgi:DNA-binding NarL/FixJ family response regulator
MRKVHLSPKQRMVLEVMATDGGTSKEIGRRIGMAEATVNGHVETILDRCGASSRLQAVAWFHTKQFTVEAS